MSITIGQYTFEGPYENTGPIEDRSGVYAILCLCDGKYHVVDVGESAQVKTRVDNHDRKASWERNCSGTLAIPMFMSKRATAITAGRRRGRSMRSSAPPPPSGCRHL